uniref:NADH-ubiquinone oxidoreductase chain 2 n=1 Tax=Palinurellus wieneckii TaxID=198231 RepID=S4V391_PALWI|nr:NADH dehydrogenase subunit 2 [Palinurellus wieneckii]AGN95864.1 NADH dehydrogenase subunit 2 [Palinurellus wieneckii]
MLFSSQRVLFLFLLTMGIVVAVSAPSWFTAWIGLELNLMSFIPLIIEKQNQYPSEAALKYFLVQALGSALVILGASLSLTTALFSFMMLMALLLKLGAAPFHFWFPAIMEGLNWPQVIVLMTIQKVAPMLLISHMMTSQSLLIITCSAMLSAVVGSLGGLNQTSLRKILAFSSINHIGWMLAAMSLGEPSWMMYFGFYVVISTSVAMLFNNQQCFHFNQLMMQKPPWNYTPMISSFSLLSLGGLPPFSGFIPKWILIESLSNSKLYLLLFVLIISTLITLYYYIRLSILSLLLVSTKKKLWWPDAYQATHTPLMLFVNLFILLTPSIFVLF